MQEVSGDVLAVDRGQGEVDAALAPGLRAHEFGEMEQVVAVRRNGVGRQAPLTLQVREKRVDALVHLPPRAIERESDLARIDRSTRTPRRPAGAWTGRAGRPAGSCGTWSAWGWAIG